MYQYDEYDQRILNERSAQFADQMKRYLAGELSEKEFLPLRLMNGLYFQRFAPMYRICIPYGMLAAYQLRRLAHIARTYDRGYGHFSTRTNMQFNWCPTEKIPEIMGLLAEVQMHSIQTSGNDIRNTTTDPLAGVAPDEIEDPRPWCEIIRQWSTFHPEFAYLPRKFKIAVSASAKDRAATRIHDIGLYMVKNAEGVVGFQVWVGGGLGRTPILAEKIHDFLPKRHLLAYLEAIIRVYNHSGIRDNINKARIKILVRDLGPAEFARQVEAEWERVRGTDMDIEVTEADFERMKARFTRPDYDSAAATDRSFDEHLASDANFARWVRHNVVEHKVPGYRAAYVSLKASDRPTGDCTHVQMDALADLAEDYSAGELRVTHDQNLVLADIRQQDLYAVWQALDEHQLATPNIKTLADMICCPGLDYCGLANAGSIGISEAINARFDNLDYLYDLGELQIKMSGCMNGCGHHSVGHIGILGVEKKGEEWYQLTVAGNPSNHDEAALGERLGRALAKDEVVPAIDALIQVYVAHRVEGERFLETVRRIGVEPFKERVYGPQKVAA